LIGAGLVMAASVLGGCETTKKDEKTPAPAGSAQAPGVQVSTEPVTLKVFIAVAGLTDENFNTLIAEPFKKKHPHITLQILRPGKGQNMIDLVTAGSIPDVFYSHLGGLTNFSRDLKVAADLRPLIKKFNMDLSRFDPDLIKQIESWGAEGGGLYSLPFTQNTFALWYNKNIFDKFGAPYPKDGMTWDDAIELARKVSRMESGVQYRGLDIYNNNNIRDSGTQLSLNVYDPKAGKAVISERWKDVFQLAMKVYEIPGNRPAKLQPSGMLDPFLKEQTLAMAPSFTNLMITAMQDAEKNGLNWDVVQTPSWKELPNVSFWMDIHQFFISNTTKAPDQAFQLLQFAMSDEVQLASAKSGKQTGLNNAEIRKQYATDLPYTKGKNIQGIFKSKSAKHEDYYDYNAYVYEAIDKGFKEVFAGTTDINSALRQAEEAANLKIEQEKRNNK
jgi:multiple sugar transport system substrate-binding protein